MIKRTLWLYVLVVAMLQPATPYRVPNPDKAGHFQRPDGKRCQTKGDHPCRCEVVCGRNGGALQVSLSDQCQWYCEEDHCDCHPCPQGECEGAFPAPHGVN